MSRILRERPSYYDKFECKGNTTCIDVCCYAWCLPMDMDTVRLYQEYEGEDGEYFRSNIYEENGEWFIKLEEKGKCPFLNSDRLCTVRLKAGEKAQIKICDVYPRERMIMAGFYRQDRLLIACSEVAKLLYTDTKDRLEFVTEWVEDDSVKEVSPELKARVEKLLAFRDGMVEALQAGAFDKNLFEAVDTKEELQKLLDDAIYYEGHELSEDMFKSARAILPELDDIRKRFYERISDAKGWLRRTAAYFAHRQLLDTIQDDRLDGPLISVFRSIHLLELLCLARFHEKDSFDLDDMIFCAHIFGLIFEISMHNVALMKEVRNRARDEEYPDGENSELRPFLYP